VDRVRDQLTVQVFGGGKMKIFFDTRTHIYEGSVLGSAPDLRIGDRVYVDTMLDGSTVFARNIRLAAANAISGRSQGVVKSYRADKGELVLRDMLSPDPVKLRLTSRTQIVQDGHAAYANQLVPGRWSMSTSLHKRMAAMRSRFPYLRCPEQILRSAGWSHLWIFILVFSC